MNRIVLAFRCFFSLLFRGALTDAAITELGLSRRGAASAKPASAPAAPAARASDGALQILGILQRDSRLVDFLMEDIAAYSDDQVGAAVRNLHEQARGALNRHLQLAPVIDGVEGTYAKLDSPDPHSVKFLGNVPASGKASGGTLRHRGWRATRIDLPSPGAGQKADIIAPAEIEIE